MPDYGLTTLCPGSRERGLVVAEPEAALAWLEGRGPRLLPGPRGDMDTHRLLGASGGVPELCPCPEGCLQFLSLSCVALPALWFWVLGDGSRSGVGWCSAS